MGDLRDGRSHERLDEVSLLGSEIVEFVRPAFELAIGNLFEVVAQGAHDGRGPPGPLLGQVVRDVGVHQGQRFGDGFAPAFQRGVHPLAQVLHVVHAHRIESGHVRGYGTRHGKVDHHERINPVGEVGGAQQRLGGLNGHQHQTSTRGLRRQVGERIDERTRPNGLNLSRVRVPVGVIGMAAADPHPLLGVISLVAPAIATGNTVVAVPSEVHPLAMTDFYQVLETSDLPGGVVNIVTGRRDELALVLAEHDDVDAIWYRGPEVGVRACELASTGNMKQTWCEAFRRDLLTAEQGEGPEYLRRATQVKNIWIPYGA